MNARFTAVEINEIERTFRDAVRGASVDRCLLAAWLMHERLRLLEMGACEACARDVVAAQTIPDVPYARLTGKEDAHDDAV